ncbi:MAG: SatD family protein [Nocardioidaceae bacterium]
MKPVATIIGDVVGSRSSGSRGKLHARVVTLLDEVNRMLAPSTPLRITVGDEYQGCFATVGQAISATLRLRLLGLPDVDLRHGVGWGGVEILSDQPRVEDGPGWWAAREAIEAVAHEQVRAAYRTMRTAYRCANDTAGPDPAPVNAALIARDALLAAASPRSVSALRGLLSGMTQRQIAKAEGITASAVSQRIRNDGLASLVRVDELLGEVG